VVQNESTGIHSQMSRIQEMMVKWLSSISFGVNARRWQPSWCHERWKRLDVSVEANYFHDSAKGEILCQNVSVDANYVPRYVLNSVARWNQTEKPTSELSDQPVSAPVTHSS
jgi:hypothetical protein